jgi:hypothetical protein
MDDTDVDERKMKHDGPKTTTTKGHDTRTVHTLTFVGKEQGKKKTCSDKAHYM